ncbi:right-handed parallel beta-helix repeat-containing protein, partial [Allorhizobium undicola]|uniref:hypothetical protein n=1 Tax=Allorhizobium undicola TaxID=78527 RepID=UPI0006889123
TGSHFSGRCYRAFMPHRLSPKTGSHFSGRCYGPSPAIALLWLMALAVVPTPVAQATEPSHGSARACGPSAQESLLEPASGVDDSLALDCRASLSGQDLVTKELVFEGEKASGAGIDCHGGTIGIPGHVPKGAPPTITIRSEPQEDGGWSVPHDIHIRNCKIYGSIVIMGMGGNGEAEAVRLSSLTPGHTARAQMAAPHHIVIDNVTLVAAGPVPLYLAPGVHHVEFSHSIVTGHSKNTALYLDAESGQNVITGNRFEIGTRNREVIAVDGSAHNVISANSFVEPAGGGVFLYRNCGQGGTIRHQTPQYNQITGNHFLYREGAPSHPAIWLGSSSIGQALYCYQDPSLPFGSGADNRSFADFNTVTGNDITGAGSETIRDAGASNTVGDNRFKP